MIALFTVEELEELARFDALVDSAPMTAADYRQIQFDEDILFPDRSRERERRRAQRASEKAAKIESGEYAQSCARRKQYEADNRERIKARKAAWYKANKERIAAQGREKRKITLVLAEIHT